MTQKRNISTKVTKRCSSTVKFVTVTCTVYFARKSYYTTVGALIQLFIRSFVAMCMHF